jgi:hypothetical protein
MRPSITNAVRTALLDLALIGGVLSGVRAQKAPDDTKLAGWRVFGDGKPLAGVEVAAHCGVWTLCRAGAAASGADGRYVLDLGPGIAFLRASGPIPQPATINSTAVIFPDEPPMGDALERITGKDGEDVQLGERKTYVHHGNGMANSRLKIPDARAGTARNINTVSRLAALAGEA